MFTLPDFWEIISKKLTDSKKWGSGTTVLERRKMLLGVVMFHTKNAQFYGCKEVSIYLTAVFKCSSKPDDIIYSESTQPMIHSDVDTISNLMICEFGSQCHTKGGVIISETALSILKADRNF